MKIHLLGSCSGTEPMPGRDYTAWVLEENSGDLLWFDAGGACSRTAYGKGLSPLRIKRLFLSHPHLDHTAGLPGLLQTINKEKWLRQDHDFKVLICHAPSRKTIDAAAMFLEAELKTPDDEWGFKIECRELSSGPIYSDAEVAIDTLPNEHMTVDPLTGKSRSYSFRIQTQDKTIIYTGDVKNLDELNSFLQSPCDLLMLETGHHRAEALAKQIRERHWPVKELFFLHHGLEILHDPVGEKALAETSWGKSVIFGSDGMTLDLR
ncbi:MAG: MBL fold metallo-hydrolase [Victivallaceae bacterium]|nr:MBL fold metallo-hydrolase [Victivallaceae bacterium]